MQTPTTVDKDNKIAPRRLYHYDVNTGETRLLLRSEVSDEELDRVRPVSAIGVNIADTPDFTLSLMHAQGAVVFTLWQHWIPMESCGVAWTAAGAQEIWPQMVVLYEHFIGKPLPAARKPAKLPWLGVMIWPSIIELETWEAGVLLDKLQKQLAWVYLEAGDSPIPSPPITKLLTASGQSIPVAPKNGAIFSLEELESMVQGHIEVALFDARQGAVLVVNKHAKLQHLPLNKLATEVCRQSSPPGSPPRSVPIHGDMVLCHIRQLR
jgi:hypothetical protein